MKIQRRYFHAFVAAFFLAAASLLLIRPGTVRAAGLSLNKSTISMTRGETRILKVSGAGKKVTWSYNKKVLAVKKLSKNKVMISGKKDEAVTEITVKSGKETATCKVEITPASDNEITVIPKGEKSDFEIPSPIGKVKEAYVQNSSAAKVVSFKSYNIVLKGMKPGRALLVFRTENGLFGKILHVVDFDHASSGKKTKAQYKSWRKKWIRENIPPDFSDVDKLMLIASWVNCQKYGNHYTGYDLWRYGSGTCVAGANMIKDFCKDLGISCKVRYAGKDKVPAGFYYGSGHYNCLVKIGKKKYHVNATPESFGGSSIFEVKK